ncbi:oligopeptide/dipeptide ABC transporter, ATPase subunit [Catenulispora acidiphila DSM 44928]|uniref:Oligopeptide/dipeptide ABC transporter, ATPase subunit n=1 Tax=Catenulispora acidiphila (strain DSM 44928 / JCM 14897 / NBRC 102108 / NRRL B-24433 / ID139908) TaxID=479433 RepID=C7Q6W6_CATAD|nr:ABC transporter ATP-binding protein [Catenulispora acidiphila]ACU75979.1 oligopeptide/dipeptide ABC transporter, ATPase subunit [Catenulispora acidiphila DSM 44928]
MVIPVHTRTDVSASARPLLTVEDLAVRFATEGGTVRAVNGLSFQIRRGRTLAVVGESGSGKSATGLAILGLHDRRRTQITGRVEFDGVDLAGLDERGLSDYRGSRIAMVFQDALTALSPYHTVERQLTDAYRRRTGASRRAACVRATDMLARVGIPDPARRVAEYPHEFSGGMRQRVMIAMALMGDPDLVIADEPTTALDVTVQAQILDLLAGLQAESQLAIMLITHDLGVVAGVAHDVMVMYAGRCVEYGPAADVLTAPEHPYTAGLLRSVPTLRSDPDADLTPIAGSPPDLLDPPSGCAFHPRCDQRLRVADDLCASAVPPLVPISSGERFRACHLALEGSVTL